MANSVGLADTDYRGEIILRFKYIWNPEDFIVQRTFKINERGEPLNDSFSILGKINPNKIYKNGDKIGQLVAEVTNTVDWIVVADLTSTVRGSGGFGSSDKKINITEKVISVDSPKTSVNLVDKWKETTITETPQKYETVAKEREKLIS